MRTLLERIRTPKKLKGKTIKTPDGNFICVALHPFGITLKDNNGNVKGVEWRETDDFRVL